MPRVLRARSEWHHALAHAARRAPRYYAPHSLLRPARFPRTTHTRTTYASFANSRCHVSPHQSCRSPDAPVVLRLSAPVVPRLSVPVVLQPRLTRCATPSPYLAPMHQSCHATPYQSRHCSPAPPSRHPRCDSVLTRPPRYRFNSSTQTRPPRCCPDAPAVPLRPVATHSLAISRRSSPQSTCHSS